MRYPTLIHSKCKHFLTTMNISQVIDEDKSLDQAFQHSFAHNHFQYRMNVETCMGVVCGI